MADKMILENGVSFSTDPKEVSLNMNVIVTGTSGCGKTMSIVVPRLLETSDSDPVKE